MEVSAPRLDTLQSIELAEGVEVRLRIAGPLLRGGALAIDFAVQTGIIIGCDILLRLLGLAAGWQVSAAFQRLFLFFMFWWYPVFFEFSAWGATPGKRMMGLRVVQTSGSPITFGQSVLRNFLRFADQLPPISIGLFYLPTMAFGLISCISTRRFQRLGDLAAGTVVVYDKILPEPVVNAPPPIAAMMPTAILRPEEVRAVIAFRDRAGLWSEGRRAEIGDHAEELTGSRGAAGVSRLMAMAHWLQERR
jgi:uncharacterized RDD family membrane protein YckC